MSITDLASPVIAVYSWLRVNYLTIGSFSISWFHLILWQVLAGIVIWALSRLVGLGGVE